MVFQQLPPSSVNCKFATKRQKMCMLQQLWSFMTHLIHICPACLHIHIVNSQDGGQLAMCWKKTTGTQTFIYNARSLWNEVSANILSQCLCSRSGPIYLVWQIVTPSLRSILHPTFFIHFISLPAACMSLSYHPTLLLLRNINIATVWINLTYMNIFFYRFHAEL